MSEKKYIVKEGFMSVYKGFPVNEYKKGQILDKNAVYGLIYSGWKDFDTYIEPYLEENKSKEESFISINKTYLIGDLFTLFNYDLSDYNIKCNLSDEIKNVEINSDGDILFTIQNIPNEYWERATECYSDKEVFNATFKLVPKEKWIPCTFSEAVNHFCNNKNNVRAKQEIVFETPKIHRDDFLKNVGRFINVSEVTTCMWEYLEKDGE